MTTSRTITRRIALLILVVGTAFPAQARETGLTLFDFGPEFSVDLLQSSDAKAAITDQGGLSIRTGHTASWPGVTLKAPDGMWDLSEYQNISMEIKNPTNMEITVFCRIDNPGADGTNHCVSGNVHLGPNASETLTVDIFPVPWKLTAPLELIGMRAAPTYSDKLDTSNITQLLLFLHHPKEDHLFEVDNIRAGGHIEIVDAETFLPFIDEFGQFIHRDWPGKTYSTEELIAHGRAEAQDLAAHPGPGDRNQYGGWTGGPQLETTGFFRVQKHLNKWWLVDPEGRLFWSHGIDCVGSGSVTPISDRENYFRALPEADDPLAAFYGSGSWAPHGYYKDHTPYKTYDFSKANLRRKYGPGFARTSAEITHRRLRSWGMNTIANWSDQRIYLMHKTPYVASIHFDSKRLEGSQGYWGKFYDVFDVDFRQKLRECLAREKDRTAGDPWCLGYFIHNELAWGSDVSLAVAALISPPHQAAKEVFVADLRTRYKTIENLNTAWDAKYPSWDAMLQCQDKPDEAKAKPDLEAFYTRTAETYFRTVREELRSIAPHQLYLGCRFSVVNDRAARAATKFCDIISYNRYAYSTENLHLPEGLDLPLIIGEFHFGALDRGMFHTGLRSTKSQQDRADTYADYVRGALRNPYIVGTHWFQYRDQATTGRGDGENYQIGFIDVCDKPYPETIEACRAVGYTMYSYRLENK